MRKRETNKVSTKKILIVSLPVKVFTSQVNQKGAKASLPAAEK
jgi:hypothetical protein